MTLWASTAHNFKKRRGGNSGKQQAGLIPALFLTFSACAWFLQLTPLPPPNHDQPLRWAAPEVGRLLGCWKETQTISTGQMTRSQASTDGETEAQRGKGHVQGHTAGLQHVPSQADSSEAPGRAPQGSRCKIGHC